MTNELAIQLLEAMERIEQRLTQIEHRLNERDTQLISLKEAAKMIGVHYNIALGYVNSGKLPAQQPAGPGGEYRIKLSDIATITRTRVPQNSYLNKAA